MAYEDITAIKNKVERLREPFKGGLIQILRDRKANKLDEQAQEVEKRNQENQAKELGMLLRGVKTGRVGPELVARSIEDFQPTDPEVRKLMADTLLKRSVGNGTPSSVSEWEYFNSLPETDQERYLGMKRGTSAVNLGDRQVIPSQVNPQNPLATFDVGLRPGETPQVRGDQAAAVEAAQTAAIPERVATQAAADRAVQLPQAQNRLATQQRQSTMVDGYIDKAIEKASGFTTGIGGAVMSSIPGTDAHDLRAILDTIEANVGFDRLQEMRNNSPTGGALGAISDPERVALNATLGSLKQSQSKEQFVQNLRNVQEQVRAIVHGSESQFDRTYRTPGINPNAGSNSIFDEADEILKRNGL